MPADFRQAAAGAYFEGNVVTLASGRTFGGHFQDLVGPRYAGGTVPANTSVVSRTREAAMVRRRVVVDEMPGQAIDLPLPPTGDEVPWIYTLEAQVQWTVPRGYPQYDFKDMFDGEIVQRRLNLPPETAGRFLAIRIRTDDAHDAGVTVPDVFGDCAPWLMPYYRALFDERTDELKKSVRMRFDIHGSNVLLLHSVLVLPDHRGRRLGLATASRLIETLGGGSCSPPASPSPPSSARQSPTASSTKRCSSTSSPATATSPPDESETTSASSGSSASARQTCSRSATTPATSEEPRTKPWSFFHFLLCARSTPDSRINAVLSKRLHGATTPR